ncbi:ribonuclease P protein component [Basilea psittacipulmonis]|uniref:ribonuclease P protein component n=1 Tax=Basilea psittacipulmonis TaxID=1472345 RepID=UPI00068D2D6C|nr:ribonuclease P protein component [Basilea psittacipulmonis]
MNNSLFKFRSDARLRRADDFARTLKGRCLGKTRHFVLMTDLSSSFSYTHPRLGLVIGKKFAKRAVSRNTIKRVIRECFRTHQADILLSDYVFRLYRQPPHCSLRALKKIVHEETLFLLQKAFINIPQDKQS